LVSRTLPSPSCTWKTGLVASPLVIGFFTGDAKDGSWVVA
jgi:hypothetical protein